MLRLMRPKRRSSMADGIGTPAYDAAGEARRAVIGATDAGRILFVVFTRRRSTVRVITARDATPAEKRRYRR